MKSMNVKTIKVTIVSHFRGILVLAAEISFLQIIVIILIYHKSSACGCQRSAVAAFRKFYVDKGA